MYNSSEASPIKTKLLEQGNPCFILIRMAEFKDCKVLGSLVVKTQLL
jgi:hypothetical protein